MESDHFSLMSVADRDFLIYRRVLGFFPFCKPANIFFLLFFQDKTHKVKVKKETTNGPAIYKFKFQRKR